MSLEGGLGQAITISPLRFENLKTYLKFAVHTFIDLDSEVWAILVVFPTYDVSVVIFGALKSPNYCV